MSTPTQISVPVNDLVQLCAVDNKLFSKVYFPKTARQEPAPFHSDIWGHLENPKERYLNLVCFRDSAKTSLLRMFTGKRIAYNVSKTILYVGASEAHAARSIRWLRARIEEKIGAGGVKKKERLAQDFALRPGVRWTDTEIEIFHGVDDTPIWILGAGITGNIRGINFDDYRPDLIICDDILTDENGATKDQRDKITDLVMGSLKGSLAPASEAPNAKLVMLNTPQAAGDVVERAEADPEFTTVRYSCWTRETQNLDVDRQESSWPARYPSMVRRVEKKAALAANQLSVFAKEKEVRIISRETATFRAEWIQFYEGEAPLGGQTCLFIDPTPPPTKLVSERAVRKLDFEVIGALRRVRGNFYLLEIDGLQGGTPDWTIKRFFEMRWRWRPYKAVVEGVAYQATLKWILEQEMKRRQQWTTVEPFGDIRAKPVRIQTGLHGVLSNGKLFIKREHSQLIEQISRYPSIEFDDFIDGLAMGVLGLTNAYVDLGDDEYSEIDNSSIPKIKPRRVCP